MRIAVMIIGLLLGALMFVQTFLVTALSNAANDEASSQAGAVGLLMALLWLVACAVVIPLPRVAMGIFVVAGLLGFAASGGFPDLAFWGGVSLFLAVLSFFGWRGKRRADLKERLRDEQMAQLLAERTNRPPG